MNPPLDLTHIVQIVIEFCPIGGPEDSAQTRALAGRIACAAAASWLTWLCVYFITGTVFCDPMTKYDGRLSVRRAFSFSELDQLAHEAGWRNFGHRHFFPARQAIWMSRKEEAPAVDLADPTLDFAT